MTPCPSLTPGGPFVSQMLGYVDCQAQMIGGNGYQALAAAGSPTSVLLTATLTMFVALFGYRMLFGDLPDIRTAVVAAVKVGIVLALATSWPAYRTLVYDVTLRAPAELAASIGTPAGLPGAAGGLVARLQGTDDALAELLFVGAVSPGALSATTVQQRHRTRLDPAGDVTLLSEARTLYLASAVAAFASVRLVAGVLLALGPLFALFLLFDATRGLFEGWIRALVGAALGGLVTAVVLGVELALLEPWLAAILAARRANISTPEVPTELLAVCVIFALTVLAGLITVARVAYGFRIPDAVRAVPGRLIETLQSLNSTRIMAPTTSARSETPAERSRAQAVADASAMMQRRDSAVPRIPIAGQGERSADGSSPAPSRAQSAIVPIGQGARRRTISRVSARARRRDTA